MLLKDTRDERRLNDSSEVVRGQALADSNDDGACSSRSLNQYLILARDRERDRE